ncbi:3-phosphoshikimate 1-carboxyvinyltransferase [Pokkaliibacter sp. CJK22405]|uniref:3-phosphoshikimate 1-carboxyvinyltransferase n=1 Tax=Pokkaliibacter sp. CJK22405 TaxID=3384615 RepID=UPI003984FAC9
MDSTLRSGETSTEMVDQTSSYQTLRDDPVIKRAFDRVPDDVADSFSETQLRYMKLILSSRAWGSHTMDWRGTLSLPWVKRRFYFVFLFGHNKRKLTRKERKFSMLFTGAALAGFLSFCGLFGLLILYLAHSATMVDRLPVPLIKLWDWAATVLGA